MNLVKVYDKDGNYKESFRLSKNKFAYIVYNGIEVSKRKAISFLNQNGLYLSSQVKVKK